MLRGLTKRFFLNNRIIINIKQVKSTIEIINNLGNCRPKHVKSTHLTLLSPNNGHKFTFFTAYKTKSERKKMCKTSKCDDCNGIFIDK